MKIKPLYDKIVVKRDPEEEKSSGGIILTGSAKEKPNQGEVVAVGTGKVLDNGEVRKIAVKVGDRVIFGPYAGSNTFEDGDDEMVVVNESDILGIVQG